MEMILLKTPTACLFLNGNFIHFLFNDTHCSGGIRKVCAASCLVKTGKGCLQTGASNYHDVDFI